MRDPETSLPPVDPPNKTNYREQAPLSPSRQAPPGEVFQNRNSSNPRRRYANKGRKSSLQGMRINAIQRDIQDSEKFYIQNKYRLGVKIRKSESLAGQNLVRRREQKIGFCTSMRNLCHENSLNNDDLLAGPAVIRNFRNQRSNGAHIGEFERQDPGWRRSRSPDLENCEDDILNHQNNEKNQYQSQYPPRNMPSAFSSRYQQLIQRGNIKWKSFRSLLKVESYEDPNRTFEMSNQARRQNRLGAVLGVNSGESGKGPLIKAIKFCKSPRSCIDLKKNVLQRRASRIRKRGSMFQVLSKDFEISCLVDVSLKFWELCNYDILIQSDRDIIVQILADKGAR